MTTSPTGRLKSSEPNLQNIPINTPEVQKIREALWKSYVNDKGDHSVED